MGFQSTVNVELGFGVPGALYDDGPVRSAPYELVSASAAYNVVGATAYTVTSGDPGDNSGSAVAAAGGTGVFAGILMNSKVYATSGTTAGALSPSMTLPNYFIGELLTTGDIIVALPGPANVGDLVGYDATTGALSTYVPQAKFTAALVSTGVLSVTAVTAGQIQVGMLISGAGVPPGIYITGNSTGYGNTGNYTTNYTSAATTIAAEAMTAPSLPPAAAAFTAVITTTGTMSVTAISSGELAVGQVVFGTGATPNPVITALGTGLGSTGTYTVNTLSTFSLTSSSLTTDQIVQIPNATVYRYAASGGAGAVGVIKL